MAMVKSVAGAASGMPAWAREEWQTAILRVKGPLAAIRLWERVLTEADRRRLGGDMERAYAQHGGAVGMWTHLRGVSVYQAVVDVGVRTGFLDTDGGRLLLRVIGEEPNDPQEAFEMAIAAGVLVLVASPRQAFWEGEEVAIDWERHGKPWEFLDELARAAKAGASLDAMALRELGGRDTGFMKKRKCALVNADGFPVTLADLVVPAGRGTYRLNLPPARIRVFERGTSDSLREWTP